MHSYVADVYNSTCMSDITLVSWQSQMNDLMTQSADYVDFLYLLI